jgi:hypothetical protein
LQLQENVRDENKPQSQPNMPNIQLNS